VVLKVTDFTHRVWFVYFIHIVYNCVVVVVVVIVVVAAAAIVVVVVVRLVRIKCYNAL